MKIRILLILFALVIMAGTCSGAIFPVVVNFSSVSTTTDITAGNSLSLSGLTFQYDPQGSDTVASIDSGGVSGFAFPSGLLGGELDLIFASPAVGLTFTYSVTGGTLNRVDAIVTPVNPAGVLAFPFSTSGTFQYGTHNGIGTVVPAFNQVELFFSNGNAFNMAPVAFDSTVPEPGTLALLACGLLGLCGRKFLRRRS